MAVSRSYWNFNIGTWGIFYRGFLSGKRQDDVMRRKQNTFGLVSEADTIHSDQKSV